MCVVYFQQEGPKTPDTNPQLQIPTSSNVQPFPQKPNHVDHSDHGKKKKKKKNFQTQTLCWNTHLCPSVCATIPNRLESFESLVEVLQK
jgi:hypothetical protein